MSEHLHSHAEPHSCSLSEHSLQFELRSTAPSFPFLFPSTPNHHVPAPTLNLSSNPPLFCGSLPKVHPPPPPPPSFPPLSFLCPTLLPGSAHDNSFIPHSAHFWHRSERALPLNSATLLVFQDPVLFCFFGKREAFTPISWHVPPVFGHFFSQITRRQLLQFSEMFIREVWTLWETFHFKQTKKGSLAFGESRCCSSGSTKWKNVGSWAGGKPWHKLSAISSSESCWGTQLTRLRRAHIITVIYPSVTPLSQPLCLRRNPWMRGDSAAVTADTKQTSVSVNFPLTQCMKEMWSRGHDRWLYLMMCV